MDFSQVLLVLIPVLGFLLADPAVASCPDVNTAVNCSFEASDSCLKAYQRYDKHGLKWSTNNGPLQATSGSQGSYAYNYMYNYGTYPEILANSPKEQYLYIRATTDPRAVGLWTDLVSPPLTGNRHGCLSFYFHNNVCGETSDARDVHFKVLLNKYSDVVGMRQTGRTLLREFPCIDDANWYQATIPINGLSGIYRVVFSAKQHRFSGKTIAVDHVTYSDQSCSTMEDDNFATGDCDFEDSSLCGYQPKVNETDTLKWMPVQKEMLTTQLNTSAQAPDGYFLCLWGHDDSASTEVTTFSIQTPKVSIAKEGCLSLTYYSGRYYKENNDVTALRLSVASPSNTLLHEFPATLGNEPITAFVTLPQGNNALVFSALIQPPFGQSINDVIFLDDIEIHPDACDQVRCQETKCAESSTPCNGRGECVGRGIKHNTCVCTSPFFGKDCSQGTATVVQNRRVTRNPWDTYYSRNRG